MTALIRSLVLAALLAAGTAYAQTTTTTNPGDNPDNPHSTKAKDKQNPGPGSREQVQQGETANPHSTDNRSGVSRPSAPTNTEPAQKENPHNPNETWNTTDRSNSGTSGQAGAMGQGQMEHGGMMGHGQMMKNATPQMMLQMLHHSNQHELEMAKMAQQKGTDRVKSYAQTLQQDHQQADQQVKDLAKKKGIALSDTPRNPQMQQRDEMMKQRFSDLKGQQFDTAFANAMSNEHRRVISMAQNWRQNCQDQDVCGLIDSLLPKLQQHEQMANQLRAPSAQGRAPENPPR